MEEKFSVAIIGAGPAGCACAIQLRRYGINCILIEKNEVGGLLWNANLIENYLGFPIGVRGSQLIQLMKDHLYYTKTPLINAEVIKCNYSDNDFSISLKNSIIKSDYLVIANGTIPKKPYIEITEPVKARMYYEVAEITEAERTDKHFAIIGSGDAAFDYALNLSQYENKIDIYIRTSYLKCIPLLAERVKNIPAINIHFNHIMTKADIINDDLLLTFESEAMMKQVQVNKLIFAIGRDPDFSILDESISFNQDKLIEEEKIYFVGDCVNGINRQSSIASGMGLNAAMNIYRKIKSKNESNK